MKKYESIIKGLNYTKKEDIKSYLDEIGIEYEPKETKIGLLKKAQETLKQEDNFCLITKYVHIPLYAVMDILEITQYRVEKLIKEKVITVDSTYRADHGKVVHVRLFRADKILAMRESGICNEYKRKTGSN